jgi:hypothetical protein
MNNLYIFKSFAQVFKNKNLLFDLSRLFKIPGGILACRNSSNIDWNIYSFKCGLFKFYTALSYKSFKPIPSELCTFIFKFSLKKFMSSDFSYKHVIFIN